MKFITDSKRLILGPIVDYDCYKNLSRSDVEKLYNSTYLYMIDNLNTSFLDIRGVIV